MRVPDFAKFKRQDRPISMVTCYDAWSAKLLARTDIDCVLVGDSLAMVMHGHPTTLPADVELMALHTRAVARGLRAGTQAGGTGNGTGSGNGSGGGGGGGIKQCLVADMPFLSYRVGVHEAARAAGSLMQAGAHAVKLEGARGNAEVIRHLVDSGIPVMGHLGFTPQSEFALDGIVQGKQDAAADKVLVDALQLQQAGCFAVVLECVPCDLAARITNELRIPTIGIGAGPACSGQVLVLHDMLGLNLGFRPRFLKRYTDGGQQVIDAINAYHNDVRERSFPTDEHSYKA